MPLNVCNENISCKVLVHRLINEEVNNNEAGKINILSYTKGTNATNSQSLINWSLKQEQWQMRVMVGRNLLPSTKLILVI